MVLFFTFKPLKINVYRVLKLSIYALVENFASNTCGAEHGLSYVVDFDDRILFDTGQSSLFQRNAAIMQVDLNKIDKVVLSHGHYDHGNGLNGLSNKTLICHPNVFSTRFSGKQRKYVGLNIDKKNAQNRFKIIETVDPYWVTEKICFLGEIPRKIGFERNATSFYLKNGTPDPLIDDSALVINMKQGVFVISGCAHSGICNIIEHAKNVTGNDRVYGVIGGFHLKFNNKQTQKTVEYLKKSNVKVVMPSHCTELSALSVFNSEFGGQQVKAGNLFTFEDNN